MPSGYINNSWFWFKGQTKDDIGPFGTIVSGGVAGTTLWTTIFPADVIKSRQQVRPNPICYCFKKVLGTMICCTFFPLQVSGVSDPLFRAGMEIIRKEGVMALYNGLTPTLIRTFPATGALFFAYEYTKKLMHQLSA